MLTDGTTISDQCLRRSCEQNRVASLRIRGGPDWSFVGLAEGKTQRRFAEQLGNFVNNS